MNCDLLSQYIKVRKLFKGGNDSRAETIRGNTVCGFLKSQKIQKSQVTRLQPGFGIGS